MSPETKFLDSIDSSGKQVIVTSERVVIGTATYATANITSVDIKQVPRNFGPAGGLGIIGFIICSIFISQDSNGGPYISRKIIAGVALLIIVGVIVLAINTKEQFALLFQTAGAERRALVSTSRSAIEEVMTAVNKAIIATRRGQSQTEFPSTQPDVMQLIQQLAHLHDAKIISDDEFETKRAELLRRI